MTEHDDPDMSPMEKIAASLADQLDQIRDRDARLGPVETRSQAEGDRRFLLRMVESAEREIKDLNRRVEQLKRSLTVARGVELGQKSPEGVVRPPLVTAQQETPPPPVATEEC
jgi:hypothetical protein